MAVFQGHILRTVALGKPRAGMTKKYITERLFFAVEHGEQHNEGPSRGAASLRHRIWVVKPTVAMSMIFVT